MRATPLLAIVVLSLAACGDNAPRDGRPPAPLVTADVALRAQQAAEDGRLIAFLDAMWEERVALSPEYQTRLGRKTNSDQWDDRSAEAADRRRALYERQLALLREEFSPENLSPDGRLNYQLFIERTKDRIALDDFRTHRFRLSQLRGIHTSIPVFLANYHRIDTDDDAEAYIARVRAVPRVLDQAAHRLERRFEAGFALPEFSYPLIAAAARRVADGAAIRSDFRRKVRALDLSTEKADVLEGVLDAALEGPFREAYHDFADRVDRLARRAAGTGNFGIARFPEADAFYRTLLRHYTSTDLTADDIHQLGLSEVARIHDDMRAIMDRVAFEGTLRQFFVHMRRADRFVLPDTEDGRARYIKLAEGYIDAIEERADDLFGVMPTANVEVRRIEPFRERSAGKAFYSRPDEDGTRPGFFYVNLGDMSDMPTYQLEALTYHETIPGHHMQRALQIEQARLPMFRRFGNETAYTEGWAVYSEVLAREIGFYEDPYSDFGRLSMELWRAARLVVDTGLHAMGWDMQQAIDYLTENTPNPRGDAVKAAERYIVLPGQATAYTIGMLKILELRSEAKERLGKEFDIRDFHDTILRAGPLPLDILERRINAWIDERAKP